MRMRARARGQGLLGTRARLRLGRLVPVILLAAGCGETSRRVVDADEALAAPSAGERMAGVAVVARDADRSRVPVLIELLDDPDPGVRLAAGATLRDLTGRDTGYRPWAEPAERRAQMEAWRRWWREGGGAGDVVRPPPAPVSVPSAPPAPDVLPPAAEAEGAAPTPPASPPALPPPGSPPGAEGPGPPGPGTLPPPVIRDVGGAP